MNVFISLLHTTIYINIQHLCLFQVAYWFVKLFPGVSYPPSRLSGLLCRIEKKAESVLLAGGTDLHDFLEPDIDLDFVSVSLTKLGLKRAQLLEEEAVQSGFEKMPLTHEVIIDLETF